MVKLLTPLGVFCVDLIGGALEFTIDLAGFVATKILPATGNEVHVPGAKYVVGASKMCDTRPIIFVILV